MGVLLPLSGSMLRGRGPLSKGAKYAATQVQKVTMIIVIGTSSSVASIYNNQL
ncbi:uncharacterized protein G2W53_003386 [Senna tora]|uniref:Uncharacterized protein n=1 Tax=Senna tora TaxID=362788 RepID=A0A834X8T5_9FABA|nr:uncharacterized protein G2W53_003386 [Senna tora]